MGERLVYGGFLVIGKHEKLPPGSLGAEGGGGEDGWEWEWEKVSKERPLQHDREEVGGSEGAVQAAAQGGGGLLGEELGTIVEVHSSPSLMEVQSSASLVGEEGEKIRPPAPALATPEAPAVEMIKEEGQEEGQEEGAEESEDQVRGARDVKVEASNGDVSAGMDAVGVACKHAVGAAGKDVVGAAGKKTDKHPLHDMIHALPSAVLWGAGAIGGDGRRRKSSSSVFSITGGLGGRRKSSKASGKGKGKSNGKAASKAAQKLLAGASVRRQSRR
jgi:hypothetical protein